MKLYIFIYVSADIKTFDARQEITDYFIKNNLLHTSKYFTRYGTHKYSIVASVGGYKDGLKIEYTIYPMKEHLKIDCSSGEYLMKTLVKTMIQILPAISSKR